MQQQEPQTNTQKLEGFQEGQQDHLISKSKQKKLEIADFFHIPQAKPILQKNFVDQSKPKVLIRQIKFVKEYNQLLTYYFTKQFLQSKQLLGKKYQSKNLLPTTMWKKYIQSQNYRCQYIKFFSGPAEDFQKLVRSYKRLKIYIQRMTQNNQFLFATYIIDLSFLSQSKTFLMKNLVNQSMEELQNSKDEPNIEFDSKFQCGNLMYVFSKNQQQEGIYRQYNLVLQNDINTKGYGNWFYFRIKSKKAGKFKFHIVNMQKTHSLYSNGMKPLIFSLQRKSRQNLDWYRDGYNICYFKNELIKNDNPTNRHYTFSFCIDQKYDEDIIFVAANYPYSYSRLVNYLDSIQKISKMNTNIYFRRQSLGLSISSNECPFLTLTWKRDKKRQDQKIKKKIILVIARQHPVQTVGSYVMEGVINNLVYLQNQYIVDLLKKYIFKIVPMVNVDGVIYGNSRCDINGCDLNRKWTKNPNSLIYPILNSFKKMVNNLVYEGYEIDYFLDLHGHSKKLGSFIYGCEMIDEVHTRLFSWFMGKINPKFCYQQCKFGISAFKKETARGCMNNILRNQKVITLQTSFYGYKTVTGPKYFEIKDLHSLGQSLLQAIYIDQTRNSKMINWQTLKSDIKNSLKHKTTIEESSESGSDSNPEQDQMTTKQKANTFLNPNIAAKIGLIEVKVVEKYRNFQDNKHNRRQSPDNRLNFEKHQSLPLDRNIQKSQMLNISPSNRLSFMKQAKSVTKITPFKISEPKQKRQNSQSKKIRIAIDFQKIDFSRQRLSSPSLPKVLVKNKKQFWSNLKKQFDNVVSEKKMVTLQSSRKKMYSNKQRY